MYRRRRELLEKLGKAGMGKIDDPKISKPIIRDPEPAGTPIERKDPPDNDKGEPGKSEIARGRQLRTKTGSFAHSGHGVDGMSSVAIKEFLADRHSAQRPDPLQTVLEEICDHAGFGLGSEARCRIAIYLERLHANGYFTVEGLRQAFVAHVARGISSFESQG